MNKIEVEKLSDERTRLTVIYNDLGESHGVDFTPDAIGPALDVLIEKLAGVSKAELLIALAEAIS